LTSVIGQLRIMGFLEGVSFLLLTVVGMPLKYMFDSPTMVKIVGQAHGFLFMLFVVYTIYVSIYKKWSFGKTTWKVLISSILPFGTFVVDHYILAPMHKKSEAAKS
jgi:integral membrane protein